MIYAGIMHFRDKFDVASYLMPVLERYTQSPPLCIKKESFTLCCGKISDLQDKDEIWENNSACLIGRVFNKKTEFSLQQQDFKKLLKHGAETLFKDVWGKSIFLQTQREEKAFTVIIDPTGQLPFFYYIFPEGDILFSSNVDIIFKILKKQPDFNWTYLCSYFVYGNSSAIQTPFKDIYELPPGCSLHITPQDQVTKTFWNPLCSYDPSKPRKKDAVDVLQATLKPWVEPYQAICVSLSGGLDSSSLVYCLKDLVRSDQTLLAVNYFHSTIKSSNELVHARQVCKETGIDLMEIDISKRLPFDLIDDDYLLLKPNKPFPGLVSLKWIQYIMNHVPSDTSSTFLSGHGSDHIFMRPPSKNCVSDYIIEKGVHGVKQPLNDITTFYRDALFSLLKDNAKSLSSYHLGMRRDKRHPKNTQDKRTPWEKHATRDQSSTSFVHPIYAALPRRVLPGKYAQIDAFYEGIASIHMELNPLIPTGYPYLYEPVVDFALSHPTYDLFKEGHDRYPLRKAVSDRFKTDTVWRRDKSQTTGVLQLGIKKNLDSILALCGEGQFVKNGFVDKEKLQETIKLISNGDTNYMWPFTHLVSAELFLQQWKNKIQ